MTLEEWIEERTLRRKKHRGATHRMSASDRLALKKREKKKKSLGIEAGGQYKLKDGKKVRKTREEIKRKIRTY